MTTVSQQSSRDNNDPQVRSSFLASGRVVVSSYVCGCPGALSPWASRMSTFGPHGPKRNKRTSMLSSHTFLCLSSSTSIYCCVLSSCVQHA